MAWRKPQRPPRVEPPLWYRVFNLAQWDEPDAQERAMMNGNLGYSWPEELHRWHAERRWGRAKYEYAQAHPQLAEQEFQDLLEQARMHP